MESYIIRSFKQTKEKPESLSGYDEGFLMRWDLGKTNLYRSFSIEDRNSKQKIISLIKTLMMFKLDPIELLEYDDRYTIIDYNSKQIIRTFKKIYPTVRS